MCSYNGLSLVRRRPIIWANAGLLLIEYLQTNFSKIWIQIRQFSSKTIKVMISSAKWRALGLGPILLMATFNSHAMMCMMTSSNGNIFRVTGPLCREFTGQRWIPCTKASATELWCFLWSAPWINRWVKNREAGDLRRYRAHYDLTVMLWWRC